MNSATTATPSPRIRVTSPDEKPQDYLMRQATRILLAGGSQKEALGYLQQYEGVHLPSVATMGSTEHGASRTFGGPNESVDVPGWGYLDGLSAHALQGITFGFGDDAIGTLNGLITGEGKQMGRDVYRARLKQFSQENPKAALGADVAGAVMGSAALPGSGALRAMGTGMGTAGRIGLAGAESGVIGAAAGAGATEGGLSERAKGAVIGGILGAGLGAAGTAAVKAVGSVTRGTIAGLQNWSKNLQASQAGLSASGTGRNLWMKAIQMDGGIDAVEEKARKMVATGAPVTLADVVGQNGLDVMQAASGFRSPEKQRMVEDIISRQADQGPRMLGQLFRALKLGTENAYDAETRLASEQQKLSRPFYEKAHTERVNVTPAIEKALRDPDLQKAYDMGRLIAKGEDYHGIANPGALPVPPLMTASPATPALYGAGGQQVSGGGPQQILATSLPVRALDYMKRGLQQLKETKTESGYAIDRQKGRILTDALNKALAEVDQQSPNFAKARSIWRGHADAQEAVQIGRDSFLQSHPTEVAKLLETMPENVKPYYILGATQQMANAVQANLQEAPNVARRYFGGRTHGQFERLMEQRVKALFGKDTDAAAEFYDYVRAEARISETAGKLGGSRTAPMSQGMEELGQAVPGGSQIKARAGVTVVSQVMNRAKTGWASLVSDEISHGALMGMNGPEELFAYLASLRSFGTPHSHLPAVLTGQASGRLGASAR